MQTIEKIGIEIEMLVACRPRGFGQAVEGDEHLLFPGTIAVRNRFAKDKGEEARPGMEQLNQLVLVQIDDIKPAQIAERHQTFGGQAIESLTHGSRAGIE